MYHCVNHLIWLFWTDTDALTLFAYMFAHYKLQATVEYIELPSLCWRCLRHHKGNFTNAPESLTVFAAIIVSFIHTRRFKMLIILHFSIYWESSNFENLFNQPSPWVFCSFKRIAIHFKCLFIILHCSYYLSCQVSINNHLRGG